MKRTVLLLALCVLELANLKGVAVVNLQLSGTVTNHAATPIAGARIDVVDPGSGFINATVFTDLQGNYALNIAAGTYNIKVTPPSGTDFQPVNLTNQVINENTTINFILVPSNPTTLINISGRVTDRFGNGVSNVTTLGGVVTNGNYSGVLTAGDYQLALNTDTEGFNAIGSVPGQFGLTSVPALSFTQDTVLDITIPATNVHVQVQDPAGNPIANATISARASIGSGIQQSVSTSRGLLPFTLAHASDFRITDSSGNAVLQLFPGDSPANYSFNVNGGGSGVTQYQPKTFSQVITPDMNLTIVLEPKPALINISGRVTDRFGNGVSNVTTLGGVVTNGNYSGVLTAGNYQLALNTDTEGSNAIGSVPGQFGLTSVPALSFTQDTVLDITIPATNVHVQVQDPAGNPIANATISARASIGSGIQQSVSTSRGLLPFTLAHASDSRTTDSSGNAVLQLFPGDSPANYSLTITPPLGFRSFGLSNLSVTPDMRLVFALQFINRRPNAVCRNVTKRAANSCLAFVSPDEVNNGSSDPDQDPLTFSLSSQGPFGLGNTPVTLTVTDNNGVSDSCTATVSVVNDPAIVTVTGPSTGSLFPVNTPVNFTGTFSDADGGPHSAQWHYDALTDAGIITEPSSAILGTVTATHTFAVAGVYPVSLEVVDGCGERSLAETVDGLPAMVVIYDPNTGSVAGGGSIDSPAGAYTLDPSAAGKAIFGFQSAYQRGATAPEGSTKFQFQTANFRFSSTAYEWLVVSGARAQFKGVGTVNGAGNYGFIVTAVDGDLAGGGGFDKLRLKIWDRSNGNAIVYDNQLGAPDSSQPTTLIRGGSITIR
jgi:hypothetical protein